MGNSLIDLNTPFAVPTEQEIRRDPAVVLGLLQRAEGIRQQAVGIYKSNVMTLGRDQVFRVRGLRVVKGSVTLLQNQKELDVIEGTIAPSAMGLRKLAAKAGLRVVLPRRQIIDGKEVANPHLERDPAHPHIIKRAWATAIAMGRTVQGQIATTVRTVEIDVTRSQIAALSKIKTYWKDEKGAGPCPVWTALESEYRADRKPGTAFRVMSEIDGDHIGLVFEVSHPKVQAALDTHQREMMFADRKLPTMAERNAIKAHPCVSLTVLDQGWEKSGDDRFSKIVNAWRTYEFFTWIGDQAECDDELEAKARMAGTAVDLDAVMDVEVVAGQVSSEEPMPGDDDGEPGDPGYVPEGPTPAHGTAPQVAYEVTPVPVEAPRTNGRARKPDADQAPLFAGREPGAEG